MFRIPREPLHAFLQWILAVPPLSFIACIAAGAMIVLTAVAADAQSELDDSAGSTRTAPTAQLPFGPGDTETRRMCSGCHLIDVAVRQRRSSTEWDIVVEQMRGRGAQGDDEQAAIVKKYLSTYFGVSEQTVAQQSSIGGEGAARRISGVGRVPVVAKDQDPRNQWRWVGGDPGAMRFSQLTQITPKNVRRLRRAWTFHYSAEIANPREKGIGRTFEVTPLVIDGVMYITTPLASSAVVALDPVSGNRLWSWAAPSVVTGRGLAYWKGDDKRGPWLIVAIDNKLVALDTKTGEPAMAFGDNGQIVVDSDLPEGMRAPPPNPVAIFGNLVITGALTGEGGPPGPSGDIRAWDISTGKLVWRFHTIPRRGEPGFETWPDEASVMYRPGANVWSMFSMDLERGLIFAPLGSPGYDWYGGDRHGANLFGNSVVALDIRTGRLRWAFQTVHHDLLDYDVTGAPMLVDVRHGGKQTPAVVQSTKQGMVFFLDRLTGEPIYGVEERPIPQSSIPGERASLTQPFPVKPPVLARTGMVRSDIAALSPESLDYCTKLFDSLRVARLFEPLGEKATLSFPGTNGGANWGGMFFNPRLRLAYVNISNIGTIGYLARSGSDTGPAYRNVSAFARFVDRERFPCQKGPWGELIAINVDTGDVAWKVPLGSYKEMEERGFVNYGAANLGGGIVTAGGVIFIAATNDRRLRAFDARSGEELWKAELDATGNAIPATYLGRDGKQYVVIAAGGPGNWSNVGNTEGDYSDSLIAFALP